MTTGKGGLTVDSLSKRFGPIIAVDGLSLTVERGTMVGFLGPNGAGKTTTMRAIVGMVKPDAGSITWNGQPLASAHQARFGYMPQERGLYPKMAVRDQLIYLARVAGLDAATAAANTDRWLNRLGLTERADAAVIDLSGGNQQRVQLAASLVHEPDLLVLDEPFAGLDPVATATMREIIAERAAAGAAVLFSSHQLELVSRLCDDVVIIADGTNLASGSIRDLRHRSPRRLLTVEWTEPASWEPPAGSVIRRDTTSVVVEVDATTDPVPLLADAATHATVIQAAFAPPELDQVFTDLVSPQHGT